VDGGHRLVLAEPGASGVRLVEVVRAQRLADLGDQLVWVPRTRPASLTWRFVSDWGPA
jgi:hypothetical protein